MDKQQASAINYNNWANANAPARQASRPDQSAGFPGREAAAAKETGQVAEHRSPDRDVSQPGAARPEKPSGKAALAEDFKAAKESTKATNQSPDPGRSR